MWLHQSLQLILCGATDKVREGGYLHSCIGQSQEGYQLSAGQSAFLVLTSVLEQVSAVFVKMVRSWRNEARFLEGVCVGHHGIHYTSVLHLPGTLGSHVLRSKYNLKWLSVCAFMSDRNTQVLE